MTARLGRLAVVAGVLALAIPALAQANEVTKWNALAVSTVNAQPALASAPMREHLHGDDTGRRVRRRQRDRPAREAVPREPPFPEGVTGGGSRDCGIPGAEHVVPQCRAPDRLRRIAGGDPGRCREGAGDRGRRDGGCRDAGRRSRRPNGDRLHVRFRLGRGVGTTAWAWWGTPACDPTKWVADAKPFVAKSASQFRTAGPYPLDSDAYAADFEEVYLVGAWNSSSRTVDQTHTAVFWNTNPAANFNAIARRFVDQLSLDLSDSARLFALLDISAADALINTWNDKYHWNFWRPSTAIWKADIDGNPATIQDTAWKPLFDPSVTDPAISASGHYWACRPTRTTPRVRRHMPARACTRSRHSSEPTR